MTLEIGLSSTTNLNTYFTCANNRNFQNQVDHVKLALFGDEYNKMKLFSSITFLHNEYFECKKQKKMRRNEHKVFQGLRHKIVQQ